MSGIRVTAKVASAIAGVSRQTIHRWVSEGHITRHPDGYDPEEVRGHADSGRHFAALLIRAGIPKRHWPEGVEAPAKKVESDHDRCA